MVLTSMSVVGQPSVLYLRRSQSPSRYQPSRPSSWILASTSSSLYGLSFAVVSTANRLLLAHYITTPPLMLTAWPVTKDASGDASQSAAAATSSGRPQRPSGVDSATERRKSWSASRANAVSIQPGHSTLTRTRGARPRARLLLNASTPPFTALNSSGLSPAIPAVTWSQLMFRIVPPLGCSLMSAPAAYEHATVPLRSTASRSSSLRSQSQSAASPVSTSAPALFTHTSRAPSRSRASATSASQASRVLRSAWAT